MAIRITKDSLVMAILLLGITITYAQAANSPFNLANNPEIRGRLTPRKLAMDVQHYDINWKPDLQSKTLSGIVHIDFNEVAPTDSFHIDLIGSWAVDKVLIDDAPAKYYRDTHTIIIANRKRTTSDPKRSITISYHGKPLVSQNPPWEAGFVWKKDIEGRPWVGVACEGEGASTWWPCKDHPSDEPDKGVTTTCTYPAALTFVSNGKLVSDTIEQVGNTKLRTTKWAVTAPINLYNVTLNLGHYALIKDIYTGKGQTKDGDHNLKLDYYVLDYNLDKAKAHFIQVKTMLAVFENEFGPYPYYDDGYKLVESHYWGMEHQSCVAYGNKYQNNKYGFDFILVHESGHEWWGNQLSIADHADLWLHESWCTYSELVYVEAQLGKQKALAYGKAWLKDIINKSPIVGPLNQAFDNLGDNDIYYKGAAMILTLRMALNNDALWHEALKGFAQLGTKPINTATAISYWVNAINKAYQAGQTKLSPMATDALLQHYLYKTTLPVLELKQTSSEKYKKRWAARIVGVNDNFSIPVKCLAPNDGERWLNIGSDWTDLNEYGAPQLDGYAVNLMFIP